MSITWTDGSNVYIVTYYSYISCNFSSNSKIYIFPNAGPNAIILFQTAIAVGRYSGGSQRIFSLPSITQSFDTNKPCSTLLSFTKVTELTTLEWPSSVCSTAPVVASHNRSVIEQTPLQLYCSALVFAPREKHCSETLSEMYSILDPMKTKMQENRNAALQTLESHSDWFRSVAFSPDGKQECL